MWYIFSTNCAFCVWAAELWRDCAMRSFTSLVRNWQFSYFLTLTVLSEFTEAKINTH